MNKSNLLQSSCVCIVLVCILLAIGIELFPPINDDLCYAMPFKDYLIGGKPFDFKMITDSIVFRYFHDNARLCNVVCILISPLPRLVGTVGSALAFMYLCFAGTKYAKIRNNSTMVALWVAYLVICFPWVDQMYLVDFQLNYLWSSAFAIFAATAFLQQRKYNTFFLGAFSLLFGAWHEGFSLPLLFVLSILALRYKSLRTTKTYVMIASMAIGLAYLITAVQFTDEVVGPKFGQKIGVMLPFLLPVLAMLITVFVNRRKITARTIILAVPAVVSAAMMIYFGRGPRIGALSVTFSGICMLLMLPSFKSKRTITYGIYTLIMLHLTAVDVQSYKAQADYRNVLSQYAKNPNRTIYSDMVLRENAPWYCLQKPYYGYFAHDTVIYWIYVFHGDENHQLFVAPRTLENFSVDDAEKIAGNVDIYYYKGLLVMRDKLDFVGHGTFCIDYGFGPNNALFMVMPFVCARDNKQYLWLYPKNSTMVQTLNRKPISFVDLEK